jgi:ketosteroid isomerase-like protein
MAGAIETVREMYAAFARGDVPAVLERLDPDVTWVTPPSLPWSRGEYGGREQVLEYFSSFSDALEDAAVEPRELLACGDRVVALGEERARIRATGGRFAVPFAHVIRVRDDRVVELRGHVDTATIAAAFAATEVAP